MDSIVAAGDEFDERTQGRSGFLSLLPISSRPEMPLPAICAAEEALTRAILSCDHLSPAQQTALLAAAAEQWPPAVRNFAIGEIGQSSLKQDDALQKFARKLARFGPWCGKHDRDELSAAGYSEQAFVQAVATVALGHLRCTLQAGFASSHGYAPQLSSAQIEHAYPEWSDTSTPFIDSPPLPHASLDSSLAQIIDLFGFVPGLLRIQSRLPEPLSHEVQLINAVFSPENHLSQIQKHRIALCLAAANCSTYLVALHGEMLNLIGSTSEETFNLLDDPEMRLLPDSDRRPCLETLKMRITPGGRQHPFDRESLAIAGLSQAQIAEAIAVAALTNFLATLQFGLGAVPDFAPLRTFHVKDLYLSGGDRRPTQNETRVEDPDAESVSKVKAGETEAFEQLVRTHTRRVFRTLFGLLGNPDEARDATQDTFLRAFEHIDKFEGRSKFSTWLTSIAVNTGTEILRRRRPAESLDGEDDEHGFKPRQVRTWVDNPEEALAKSQVNDLVRKAVLRLPEKYRTALLLRDINQLSTEETAEALSLTLPATKARILRGRLMLRESLAPHFTKAEGDRRV